MKIFPSSFSPPRTASAERRPAMSPTSASGATISPTPTSGSLSPLAPRSKHGISLFGHEIVGHRPGKPGAKTGQATKLTDWLPFKVKSHKDDHIPPRLREKVAAVEQAMSTAHGPLKAYGKAAISTIRHKQLAGPEIIQMDIANLGAIADVENIRNPGLNLRQFHSQESFIEALKSDGPASFRAVLPLSDARSGKPVPHHVMADVRLHPGSSPTVILTESAIIAAGDMGQGLMSHNHLLKAMESNGVKLSGVALIEADAQKSTTDCVMYSLNYALKANKNAALFDELHANLQRGKGPVPGVSRSDLQSQTTPESVRVEMHGDAFIVSGSDLLSADFYKHAASSKRVNELTNRAGPRMSGQVNSANQPQPETLAERVQAFGVEKPRVSGAKPGDTIKFSASIEGFRLQEIERAMAAAAGKPIVASKGSSAGSTPPRTSTTPSDDAQGTAQPGPGPSPIRQRFRPTLEPIPEPITLADLLRLTD